LAEEKDLHEIFSDCSLGAIPPVGRAYGVNVLFDDHLTECEDIYFEAGDHTDLIHVSGKDFLVLMGDASHGEFSRHI
jgi:Ala-tRNA(Pro) deacylase